MTEGGKPQFHGKHYSLFKAIIEKVCVIFPEIAQDSEVWTIHPGNVHEGQVFITPLFYLSRAENTLTIGKYQYRDNEAWMVSILPVSAVVTFQAGRIKLFENIAIQVTFMFA